MTIIRVVLAQLVVIPLLAAADDSIVTDRPDFTEAATTVGNGKVQLESGLTAGRFEDGSAVGFPELLVRAGASDSLEFRIGAPDYSVAQENGRAVNGFGDYYAGAKISLGPLSNGDELALIPAVNLPSKDGPASSGSADPELKVAWSRDLNEQWALGVMGYGLWTTDNDRVFRYQQTGSFSRKIGESFGTFFEYAGTFGAGQSPDHVFHTGLVHLLDDDVQVDIHGGFFLNGSHQMPFFGLGFGARF